MTGTRSATSKFGNCSTALTHSRGGTERRRPGRLKIMLSLFEKESPSFSFFAARFSSPPPAKILSDPFFAPSACSFKEGWPSALLVYDARCAL